MLRISGMVSDERAVRAVEVGGFRRTLVRRRTLRNRAAGSVIRFQTNARAVEAASDGMVSDERSCGSTLDVCHLHPNPVSPEFQTNARAVEARRAPFSFQTNARAVAVTSPLRFRRTLVRLKRSDRVSDGAVEPPEFVCRFQTNARRAVEDLVLSDDPGSVSVRCGFRRTLVFQTNERSCVAVEDERGFLKTVSDERSCG